MFVNFSFCCQIDIFIHLPQKVNVNNFGKGSSFGHVTTTYLFTADWQAPAWNSSPFHL